MASRSSVLLVDDCAEALEVLALEFANAGMATCLARDGEEGWARFRSEPPDLVVSDVRMPNGDGFELLRRIRAVSDVPVILLTAYAEIPLAVSAIHDGAEDYIRYPDDLERLLPRAQELLAARGAPEPRDAATELLPGGSPAMCELRRQLRRIAPLDAPVLVFGEAGSGRGRTVRALHALSPAHTVPLVTLGTSDLAPGRQPCALLLEDVEQLEPSSQERWLHQIRGTYHGSDARIVRFYATSHPSLAHDSRRGRFDAELWSEISRLQISVPPLRNRRGDIARLASEFVREHCRSQGRARLVLSSAATRLLEKHPWPENVRELGAVMERTVLFARGSTIHVAAVERALERVIADRVDGVEQRRAAQRASERDQLVRLLDECGGNVAEMARRLDLTRGAVVYRLKKHGLMR